MSIVVRKVSDTVVSLRDHNDGQLIAVYKNGIISFPNEMKSYLEVYSEKTLLDMCRFVLDHSENWFSIGNFGSD